MNKSHFIFSYAGNKRNEVKHLIPLIPEDATLIIEPFCGSSAMSFGMYKHNKNLKFVLNDSDTELINVYNLLKNEDASVIEDNINKVAENITNKEEYEKCFQSYKLSKNIYEFIYFKRYSKMSRVGLCDAVRSVKRTFKFTAPHLEFINFIKSPNVTITNKDWKEIYEEYLPQNPIFLMDPPYLLSYNELYKDK